MDTISFRNYLGYEKLRSALDLYPDLLKDEKKKTKDSGKNKKTPAGAIRNNPKYATFNADFSPRQ
jgi:hypothetical protein